MFVIPSWLAVLLLTSAPNTLAQLILEFCAKLGSFYLALLEMPC